MQDMIIVFNCGSSSIKFALIHPQTTQIELSGLAEKLGQKDSNISFKYQNNKITETLSGGSYEAAFNKIKDQLLKLNLIQRIHAVGHRVVHGGVYFKSSVMIDNDVLMKLKEVTPLAPLHNPANIAGIEFCQKILANLPQVAVFDTAFHQTMSQEVYNYAIPHELAEKHHIRKYGFHGISHHYVSQEVAKLTAQATANVIVAHLGNGASVTAVKAGKSVDTSMGMTPLDGLVMGTRSGTIDPGIFNFLAQNLDMSVDETNTMLNKKSGLLGLCDHNDMREIEALTLQKDTRAELAIDLFCHRLAQFIAGYLIYFDHFDGLVFTGGIGENSTTIRAKTIEKLKNVGFAIDKKHNQSHGQKNHHRIDSQDSLPIFVINTNEELMIANDTALLTGGKS
ncbi:MAG: acetate/propionate family kinase [Francisellaceae bacterium]